MSRVSDGLTTAGFGAAWRLARLAPEPVAYRAGDAIADRVTRREGQGVRRLRSNLARALPEATESELDELVRDGMRSYVRYWVDAFRLPGWSAERVEGSVRVVGDAPVRASLASGRGVVAALGHLGNWDHAGAWAKRQLGSVTTVAERLRPEGLYDRFVAFRTGLGMEILPLTGGAPPIPVLTERLQSGTFVPLLADRDLTGRGIAVELLGRQARVAGGPALLAARTGAALHPITITYERRADVGSGWGIVIEFHPEIDVGSGGGRAILAAVQSYADAWTSAIRAHPADWHMLQRIFTEDLRGA